MELRPLAPTAKAPAVNFTGDVYVNPVYRGEDPSRMIVSLVRFTPGARTNWHSHAIGQTLHVTDGIGLVVTRDGTVIRMRPGDTVYIPPGEEHWHGATDGNFMCHLAMLIERCRRVRPRGCRGRMPRESRSSGPAHLARRC